ncbi:MAG: class I SAM-dependent methyltransferase [Acidobacteriota bacterium]
MNLDCQVDYWNRVGPQKTFGHPLNFERLRELLSSDSRILDLGCGYGRALGLLWESGYRNLIGVDPAPAMVAAARARFPAITFEEQSTAKLPLADASVDATLLFSVLTCVPTDEGQRTIVKEVGRVLRPGGLLYISDLGLQKDARNLERYARDQPKYGTYGVFELPEGVTVRHHDPRWIDTLTQDFDVISVDQIEVVTMNGHAAQAFQWFGAKR